MPKATVRAPARILPESNPPKTPDWEEVGRGLKQAGRTDHEIAAISLADKRAELNWLKYREQKNLCNQLPEGEKNDAEHDFLYEIEHILQADIGVSVQALGAVLIIEIEDMASEEVKGLNRASLAAIRPQLVGFIAEAADRVLAEEGEART